jgi:primosomal protein N' (replication factor Y) (superfamily II helicase)
VLAGAGAVPAGAAPLDVEVLGPVELDPEPGSARDAARDAGRDPTPRERALLRVPRVQRRALAAALAGAQALRSARKATEPVRVRLDPPEVG